MRRPQAAKEVVRPRTACLPFAVLAALLASGCGRETIGLGRNPPDAAPAATTIETPPARPDAAPPKATPSASATHSAPQTQVSPPPTKLPTRPAEHDAGTHLPIDPGHVTVTDGDGGQGCKGPTDCNLNEPYCDVGSGKCVSCLVDIHCGFGLHCDLTEHECVCSSDAECRTTGRCDSLTRQCLVPCTSNTTCMSTLISPICEMDRSVCVQCLTDAECMGKTLGGVPIELCRHGLCVQCWEESQCTSPKAPHCQILAGICVECLSNADCPDKVQCLNGFCLVPPTGSPGPASSSTQP